MTRHHVLWPLLSLFVAALRTVGLPAQEIPPANPQLRAAASPKALVMAAYEKTKTASSERDFAEVAAMLDKALQSDALIQSHRDYALQLKGWAHNRLGEALADRGRESAALAQFDMAVQLNGNHWKARHNRGVSYAIAGSFDKALEDFSYTIRLKPKFANAWFNRAEIYAKKGELREAIRDYNEAIRRAPDDPVFYHARGSILHRWLDYDRAIPDYDRAIDLNPKYAEAFVDRGDAYTELGKYEKAAEDYRSALSLDDQLGRTYRSLAWLMATCPVERFRDADRAVVAAQKALQLDGDTDYRYLETLAASLANAGQFPQAVAMQKRAIQVAAKSIPEDQVQLLQNRLQQFEQQQPYRQERIAGRPSPLSRAN